MPSAASAPAKSSAERVRANESPSDHAASESSARRALVAATAPGAPFRMASDRRVDPGVERLLVIDHAGQQARRGRLACAEGLAGEHGTGEEPPVRHAERRYQDHGRRHAHPDLAEGERAGRGGDREVGRGDEAQSAGPGVPTYPGDDRYRGATDRLEDLGHAGADGRRRRGEVGARAERPCRWRSGPPPVPLRRSPPRPDPRPARRGAARRARCGCGESRASACRPARGALRWTSSVVTDAQCRGPATRPGDRSYPNGNLRR